MVGGLELSCYGARVTLRERYLDLLVEAINGSIYGEQTYWRPLEPQSKARQLVTRAAALTGGALAREVTVPPAAYERGVDWPEDRRNSGVSMIGRVRLGNVRQAVETVLAESVPGDLIETGVWRGGACILMRGVLAAHDVTDRAVYVADSFQGLPAADESDDAAHLHDDDTLVIARDQVAAAFERFGLLDGQVRFLEGWFADTLPTVADRTWAVVRLDGDQYGSTMDGLTNLYPRLSPGGFLIVDDYGAYDACRRAVRDYRAEHDITEPIIDVDGTGACWRKAA